MQCSIARLSPSTSLGHMVHPNTFAEIVSRGSQQELETPRFEEDGLIFDYHLNCFRTHPVCFAISMAIRQEKVIYSY